MHDTVAGWFDEFHEDLLRRISGLRVSDSEARDLAQEVFLRLLRVSNPDLVRHPRAYMLRVAANVLQEWRLRGDRFVVTAPAELDTLPSHADPIRDIDGEARARQLNKALASLPPMYRAAVALRAQYGLSVAQVAIHLGVSERMVKRYIEKGYAALRDRLAESRTDQRS